MATEKLLYGVQDNPPWYLVFFLALQQFLTCFGAVFTYPLIISSAICLTGDQVGLAELINTVIFVCGLASILQCTFGIRLPIIQGASYSFITPVFVMMKAKQCPFPVAPPGAANITVGSDEHRDIWQSNMSEVSGALMVASVVQIIFGFSGLIGVLIRFIGPLTIAPTISLIGLSLFQVAYDRAATHWWICFFTILLITVFSQYLRNVGIPFFGGTRLNIFSLFPVLLGMVIAWLFCLILTATDVFNGEPGQWGYEARTDIRIDAMHNAEWFRFPYPGQWGVPSITVGGFLGMMAASIASMIESVGDYYACARLCGVSSPPGSAISRGIGMEGIACLLAGAWGAGGGNTSYSENIGAIGITKVGSRLVVQIAGILMLILGCFGKFGALFVMLPDPIVGGLFYVMFGMVTAVGISNLQYVDLNSTRNLFVFGFSLFFGLSVPQWVAKHPFDLSHDTLNQVLDVLCGTSMLVGGVIAFILDNTIPGTKEERGLIPQLKGEGDGEADWSIYNLPWIQSTLDKLSFTKFIPFCPGFFGDRPASSEELPEFNHQDRDCEDIAKSNAPSRNGVDNETFIPEKVETRF